MIISQKMSNNNELEENLNGTHCSSCFQSSCPSNGFIPEKSVETRREEVGVFVLREQQVRDQGWSKSLRGFPGMSESVIEKTLIAESPTFPQKSVAPNAYRHRKQGYQLLSHKNLLLQMPIDTGSKGTRVKLHHTTAILPTSQMSTGEPNDLSLALAISGDGDPRHPLRGTPLLHIKSSDAVLKNLILVADRINFTRMR